MYKWKPNDLNDPFKMRKGEKILNLERYVELLKKNNISFTDEQYEAALNEFNNRIK